jgi:hypothetical protein
MRTIKRIIWILIVLAIGAYFVNYYIDKKEKERARQEERQQIEDAVKKSVNDMVAKFNAISNWENKLSNGKKVRINKILTIELEKLWLTDKPILFLGSIEDISTLDDKNYLVRIKRSIFSSSKYFFATELGVELKIEKTTIDSFLDEHTELLKDFGLSNGVAVISEIKDIKTEYFTGEEGEKVR